MFGGNKFKLLGLSDEIIDRAKNIGWTEPAEIQRKVIPLMLKGADVVALAETGSGKTGAFALPILEMLYEHPKQNFALILTPTHELAIQIKNEFMKLGGEDDLNVVTLIGGDFIDDHVKLLKSQKFHIIIGTPGRLSMLIKKHNLPNFRNTKFLILDEADRMLSGDFVIEIETIVAALPKNHQTCLFSATMTNKLEKLEIVCVKDPIRVEVSRKHQTVEKLKQEMVVLRDYEEGLVFLVWKLQNICNNSDENELSSVIVFTDRKKDCKLIFKIFKEFDISVTMLQSDMTRIERQESIDRFSSGKVSVLVATDVASRGLDIPNVGLVINYGVPDSSKDYQHRVGRTARAGRAGLSISLVTIYYVRELLLIERDTGIKMTKIPMPRDQTIDLRNELLNMLSEIKMSLKEEDEIKIQKKNKRKENTKKMIKRKRKHD